MQLTTLRVAADRPQTLGGLRAAQLQLTDGARRFVSRKPLPIRGWFRHVVAADMALHGFDMVARTSACARRLERGIEQRVDLVTSRSRAGERVLTMFVGASVDAFRGAPGLYGPGLDWVFTLGAIVGNPLIDCEIVLPSQASEDQVEAWLRSMLRELQGPGMEFFGRTQSIDGLLGFSVSDFCRGRAASYSEVYARLQRAMLFKLVGRAREFEAEIELAVGMCKTRWQPQLREFVEFLRDTEV